MVEGIPPMHGKALQAFRNNDFTPNAAIAEVIDNSIQAESKNIKIYIKFETPQGKQKPIPHTIAFGDDGIGMEPEILQTCLVLGESTRTNDRDGIGRFGVGMTNGAISLCNRIQVYSRPKQGNWNYVQLNLKELDSESSPYITFVEQKSKLPDEFKNLVGDNGTLVIWDDIDRIPTSFSTGELNHWISRTFRKFIGEKIIEKEKIVDNQNKIYLSVNTIGEKDVPDGTKILDGFDPLYVIPSKDRPTDETAVLLDDWEIEHELDDAMDPVNTSQKTGKIKIRFSFTPKSWRKEKGAGGSTENNARYLFDNEGVSILRNGREVSYGIIPNWVKQFVDKDRMWSCEIDFEAVLDAQFSVKNIKVGARPLPDMRIRLQNEINPPRYSAMDKVSKIWSIEQSKSVSGGSTIGGHEGSKSSQEGVITALPPIKLTPEEIKKQEESLKRKEISEKETKEITVQLADPEGPKILLYDSLKTSSKEPYMEIERLGSKTVVWLNNNHIFFQEVFKKLKEIDELAQGSQDPIKTKLVELASSLKIDIDRLIISYTDTQNNLIKTEPTGIDTSLEKLILGWSLTLRRLYEKA